MDSMPKVKPCPFCGSNKYANDSFCDVYFVKCSSCGAEGPMVNDYDGDHEDPEEEARKLWNEMRIKPPSVTRSEAFAVLSAIRDRTPNGLIGEMTDEQLCQFIDIANMVFQLNLPNSQPVIPADFVATQH